MSTSVARVAHHVLTGDYEWATGINRVALEICGVLPIRWNFVWRNGFDHIRLVLWIITMVVFSMLPQTLALITVWGDLNLVCDNLMIYLPFTVSECKIITLWYHRKVIGKMVESIKTDWLKDKTDDERAIMLQYASVGRIITIGIYTIMMLTAGFYHVPLVFGFILRPMTNLTDTGGDRRFVLQTVYWFNAYRSPMYELMAFIQAFSCFVSGLCYTTGITLFGTLVLHVSSQLEILVSRIEKMVNIDDDRHDVYFQKIFESSIEEHLRLIRFVDTIEETFNGMLLKVVVTYSCIVCIQVYQMMQILTTMNPSAIETIISLVFFVYIVFIMFIYAAIGETLLVQGEKVQWAAYCCQWYNLRPREAAQLIPMMAQARRPLKITAGKFVPVTLETFAALQKTTAGYISFLAAFEE